MSSHAESHGHTPAAWTVTIAALIGCTVSGVAMIMATPLLFWIGVAVVVVGAVAGQGMRMAGLGNVPARG